MTKHMVFVLIFAVCGLNACGDKDNNSEPQLPADGTACDSASFDAICRTDSSYIVCEENQIATKNCDPNWVCVRGECKDLAIDKESCVPTEYQPKCIDDTHRKLCSADGKVETEICTGDLKCTDGYCGGKGQSGEKCDPMSYRNSCEGTKRTACDWGTITEYDCADDSMICDEGECKPVSIACDEKTYKDKCIGNRLYYCRKEEVDYDICGWNEYCLNIDNVVDCYRACFNEGEIYYYCGHLGWDDEQSFAKKYTCTNTKYGLFWVVTDESCEECYAYQTGAPFEQNGDKSELCLKTECSGDTETCDGNQVSACKHGYELKYDCGNNKCVVYDEEAICAKTCTAAENGKHISSCEVEDYYYVSNDYVCTQIGENYYWLYDRAVRCEQGCNSENGECIKVHEDEYKPCSWDSDSAIYYEEKCDKNVYLHCAGDDGYVIADKCSENSVCLTGIDDIYDGCHEECTAAEVGNPEISCIGETESKSECTEVAPGKYIYRNSLTHCVHGCDSTTSQCKKLHPDEFKACDPEITEDTCYNGNILSCTSNYPYDDGDTIGYVYYVNECPRMYDDDLDDYVPTTCIQDNNKVSCLSKCSAADVNTSHLTCYYDYIEGKECVKSGDDYYWKSVNKKCLSYCDAHDNQCEKVFQDEGMPCGDGYDVGDAKCIANNRLVCNQDKVWEFDQNCSESDKVCIETDKRATCTIECSVPDDTLSFCELSYNDDENELSSNYLQINKCVFGEMYDDYDYLGDGYHWENDTSKRCEHGCDLNTDTCIKLHPDEDKTCSDDPDSPDFYETRCDNNVYLYCNPYYEEVMADKCIQACRTDMHGCYEPCDKVGDIEYVCVWDEIDHDSVYTYPMECVEDPETHIKYYEYGGYEFCSTLSCDATNGCG